NYNYQERYMLEALGRYDGSYLYGPGQRWSLFPGFSAAWRLTQDPLFGNALNFLDELKLRASWGQAGREMAAPWDFLGGATYGTSSSILDGQIAPGIRPRGLPATNLSWAISTTRNVGVDFAL